MNFYSYSSRVGTELISKYKWKHQLLISNKSFLNLIKAVEKYIQVFSSRV